MSFLVYHSGLTQELQQCAGVCQHADPTRDYTALAMNMLASRHADEHILNASRRIRAELMRIAGILKSTDADSPTTVVES